LLDALEHALQAGIIGHVQAKDIQIDERARTRYGVFGKTAGRTSRELCGLLSSPTDQFRDDQNHCPERAVARAARNPSGSGVRHDVANHGVFPRPRTS